MADVPDERRLVVEARAELDEWVASARREAYEELFAGDSPLLDDEELRLLDEIDSELARQTGDGVWGTDEYGVYFEGSTPTQDDIGVVCVYHPQITADSVLRGEDAVTDEQEERINRALWEYAERVVALVEKRLDEYLRDTRA